MVPHAESYLSGEWKEREGTKHATGDEKSDGYKRSEFLLRRARLAEGVYVREVSDELGEVCEEHAEKVIDRLPELLKKEEKFTQKKREQVEV